ncbi:hypothetical protein GCM10010121_097130 [Streptomyces brasiliensis]|uniref:Uncharacterized protein n=2 Tax=Streptomyces brasiliensis TaxID=1954 RepID=A0A917PD24_9ACTN|nr:hypothetical protein GCM10010121_097130 [Streptomyces brasiliensis]
MPNNAIPEWVEVPLQAALRDLAAGDGAKPEIAWCPEGDDAGTVVAAGVEEGKRLVRDDVSPANLLVEVADWLQSIIVPAVGGAQASPRLACPGHDHPMVAKNVYAVAWWTCPASQSPVALIGEV